MPTPTLTSERTLGPLTATQRTDIMSFATTLSPQARQLFRRLLILGQEHGLDGEFISRSAAQARAHFEN
ncbi:MAG TPA: hypothetical protein VGQ62_03365 [Chloroflexota bacterium]|jgi:hypothetical protein|nr:hypothetical protein [Chloroflexota bacterium]